MRQNTLKLSSKLDAVYFSPVRTVLEKANAIAASGRKVIHMEIGEPDFDTPIAIVEETAHALVNRRLTHYGSNRGSLKLRESIADMIQADYGMRFDPQNEVLITVGAAEALYDVIFSLVDRDDEVVILTPAFMNYENDVLMAGGRCVKVALREADDFQISREQLEQAITDRTRLLIVNNPHNPTGTVLNKASLQAIADVAIDHDILVLSDEIYSKMVYGNSEFTPLFTLAGMRERTLTVNGFSKVFSMTGWRMGYITCSKHFLPSILKVHQYTTTCAPTFIQEGLAIGMRKESCAREVSHMISEFDKRRIFMLEALRQIQGLSCPTTEGAFYIFVNVSGTGLTGEAFASRLLDEKGIATVPGLAFGSDWNDYIRISYGTDMVNLESGIELLKDFVYSLPSVK